MASKPTWRRVFDTVERAVGSRLEEFVQTETFAGALSTSAQVQAELRRRTEQATRRALHLVNLPAGSDMRRLNEQIAGLERRLRHISRQIEDISEEESDAVAANPARPAPAQPQRDAEPDPVGRRAQRPPGAQRAQVRRRGGPPPGRPDA
ncbi:MAG: hypothetical protein M3Z02_07940 [Actinomycetota bacterium]|nr:hypothetical protein [Actinomycetota bacterium]